MMKRKLTFATGPVLAISSSGGHWVQLLRLRPAWEGLRVVYATVDPNLAADVPYSEFHTIPDGNIKTKAALIRMAFRIFRLVRKVRPSVVVTTGAAPGFWAVAAGRLYGARTLWIDSIANVSVLSLAGRNAGRFADSWLTQWPELADESGPEYHGSVM